MKSTLDLEDYYSILGVPRNATAKQIRERFLHLAREQHPDRASDEEKNRAEVNFQKITQAYNVLYDPSRRQQYDQQSADEARAPTEDVTAQAARVYLQRGVEAYKKKRFQEAVNNLEKATEENPKETEAWYYLAMVCSRRTSLLSRGLAAASQACKLEPSNARYLKLAGDLAAQVGVLNQAAKYYRDALTYGGDDPEVRRALKSLRKAGG